MRAASLLVILATLPASGCAALIAASGREPNSFTEQQVRAEHPDAVATSTEGGTSLTFRTREKIADRTKAYSMGYAMTLGLGEFVWFPWEVYGVTRGTLLGQMVRVRYDSDGKVIDVTVDGKPVG
jgi:hypothetical protein